MEITFTQQELSKFVSDVADWYNSMSMFVITNGFQQVDHLTGRIRNPQETFHRLAKQFQEENPKPDWRQML